MSRRSLLSLFGVMFLAVTLSVDAQNELPCGLLDSPTWVWKMADPPAGNVIKQQEISVGPSSPDAITAFVMFECVAAHTLNGVCFVSSFMLNLPAGTKVQVFHARPDGTEEVVPNSGMVVPPDLDGKTFQGHIFYDVISAWLAGTHAFRVEITHPKAIRTTVFARETVGKVRERTVWGPLERLEPISEGANADGSTKWAVRLWGNFPTAPIVLAPDFVGVGTPLPLQGYTIPSSVGLRGVVALLACSGTSELNRECSTQMLYAK